MSAPMHPGLSVHSRWPHLDSAFYIGAPPSLPPVCSISIAISHLYISIAAMVLLRELGLVAFLALTHSANALYSKGGAVLNLDEKGFKKEILLSENVAVGITEFNFVVDWS